MYNLKELINNIINIYTKKGLYEMHKSVVDFHAPDGSYIGDYFNLFIQERVINGVPKLYHIGGPFDIVSNQAPQRAICFQGGQLLVNQDITHEVDIRTAAMNFVVFTGLGLHNLQNKNILILGTGKIAREFLKQLKECDPAVSHINYYNHHGVNSSFKQLGNSLGIDCSFIVLDSLSTFDIIVIHTSSKDVIITAKLFETTKSNVIITTFAGSHTQGEIAGNIYTNNIQLIVDRDQTITDSKEINHQVTENKITQNNITSLEELFTGKKDMSIDRPIIYRSVGAPMQTLAIVKMMIPQSKN